jgi:DNA-directed RNA polymerase subunit beta-beta'
VNFGQTKPTIDQPATEIPNLIESRRRSYKFFLQNDLQAEQRADLGLQAIFNSVFPIVDSSGLVVVKFSRYSIDDWERDINQYLATGMTIETTLELDLVLEIYDRDNESGEKIIKRVRRKSLKFGAIPLMTERGTFVIKGVERVIVPQLRPSPGVFFGGQAHASGQFLRSARIIPARGSILELEFDAKAVLYARFDRRRKFPATVLLKALGFSFNVLWDLFSENLSRTFTEGKATGQPMARLSRVGDSHASFSFQDALAQNRLVTREEAILELYRKNHPLTSPTLEEAQVFFNNLFFNPDYYDLSPLGRSKLNHRLGFLDSADPDNQDNLATTLTSNDILAVVKELIRLKETDEPVDDMDHLEHRRLVQVGELLGDQFRAGLALLKKDIDRRVDIFDLESITLQNLIDPKIVSVLVKDFFEKGPYSQLLDQTNPLSEFAHHRRLSVLGPRGLTRESVDFKTRAIHPSHYGRLCPVDTPLGANLGLVASLATYARVNESGFLRTPYWRVTKGLVTQEAHYFLASEETDLPIALANARLGRDGQFIDELVACRLNGQFALAPASEVRLMDVASNQLLSWSASLVPFLDRDEASQVALGANFSRRATPLLTAKAPLVGVGVESMVARESGAVVVATIDGVVKKVDANCIVIHNHSPEAVERGEWLRFHKLKKFLRSNNSTCVNQKPLVRAGEVVKKGQIIADGPATEMGELALGRDVLVAFTSWWGQNSADAIVVSERLVKEDLFASARVEVYEIAFRETKFGSDKLTREIPTFNNSSLDHLDASGVVRVGSKVKAGDILVGRLSPNVESRMEPEKLISRAIYTFFGQASEDTSLRVPPGVEGVVIDTRLLSQIGEGLEDSPKEDDDDDSSELSEAQMARLQLLDQDAREVLFNLLGGQILKSEVSNVSDADDLFVLKKGRVIDRAAVEKMSPFSWYGVGFVGDESGTIGDKVDKLLRDYFDLSESVKDNFDPEAPRAQEFNMLPLGVNTLVKVYVAVRRKLAVGDQLADRHGYKGVVSRISPEEDMPFLEDGRPVDLVINPLSVLNQKSVGRILEANLGWASQSLGREIGRLIDNLSYARLRIFLRDILGEEDYKRFFADLSDQDLMISAERYRYGLHLAVAAFDGANEAKIQDLLRVAGLPASGQTVTRDGRTGESLANEVTVGVTHMFKLHPDFNDQARPSSFEALSPVTRQPLTGRRLGEMEVWALEAYGAAHTLRQFLTVKSDDVLGRFRWHENIVNGEGHLAVGWPDSFSVLVKKLWSLGLDVELIEAESGDEAAEPIQSHWRLPRDSRDITQARVGLASPDQIRRWSHGEVKTAGTFNFGEGKPTPRPEGLFCDKIFGLINDYECYCGKYKGINYRDRVCEKCGGLVSLTKARRERFGRIELAAPVAHVWFWKTRPSPLAELLGVHYKDVRKVLRFKSYLVIDPKLTSLAVGQILTPTSFQQAVEWWGRDSFEWGIGAAALKRLLNNLDLGALSARLRADLASGGSKEKRAKLIARLRVVESFRDSGDDPSWMILETIPVSPPDLRPLAIWEGGRLASSDLADLNELYCRVIVSNNRLKFFLKMKAPEITLWTEMSLLQRAVDALLDNGSRGQASHRANDHRGDDKRPLKSLSAPLQGQPSLFRQCLYGKRVDYSGRAVIAVNPDLSLGRCGLPRKMALELFRPYLYHHLLKEDIVSTVKEAQNLVRLPTSEVWDALEKVTRDRPILLHRTTSPNRLGVQAFEPILIDGQAIQLSPLVAAGFNVDFKGERINVHVPLSRESQNEARALMTSANNILSSANGEPSWGLNPDMVLGLSYLTMEKSGAKGEGSLFASVEEVRLAYDAGALGLQARMTTRLHGQKVSATIGRLIFYEIFPPEIDFSQINKPMSENELASLIAKCYRLKGAESTSFFLERLQGLGLQFATQAGLSIRSSNLIRLISENESLEPALGQSVTLQARRLAGLVAETDKRERLGHIWTRAFNQISERTRRAMESNLFQGRRSEERGTSDLDLLLTPLGNKEPDAQAPPPQLVGAWGVVAKTPDEIMESFVPANFRTGLAVSSFLLSTLGARKRLVEAALKKAKVKSLTRRLMAVARESVISEHDCGTSDGLKIPLWPEKDELGRTWAERVLGRTALLDIVSASDNALIVAAGEEIDEAATKAIEKSGLAWILVRSVLTCRSRKGVCAKCYGRDLAQGQLVAIGAPVGVNAALCLGQLSSQLSERTLPIEGEVERRSANSVLSTNRPGFLVFSEAVRLLRVADDQLVVMGHQGEARLLDENKTPRETYSLVYGARLKLKPQPKPVVAPMSAVEELTWPGLDSYGQNRDWSEPIPPNPRASLGALESPFPRYGGSATREPWLKPRLAVAAMAWPKKLSLAKMVFCARQLDGLTRVFPGLGEDKLELAKLARAIRPLVERLKTWAEAHNYLRKSGRITATAKNTPELRDWVRLWPRIVETLNAADRLLSVYDLKLPGEARRLAQDFDLSYKEPETFGDWEPLAQPILTEVAGYVFFEDVREGENLVEVERVADGSGASSRVKVIIKSKGEPLSPYVKVAREVEGELSPRGQFLASYRLPERAILLVKEKSWVRAGDVLAKIPRSSTRSRDIPVGLARLVELFQARKPKNMAVISAIEGLVSFDQSTDQRQKVIVTPQMGEPKAYEIPKGRRVIVDEADFVRAGDLLTTGWANPGDILAIRGAKELAKHLVNEAQRIFRLQSLKINDKHIEVIVRRTLGKVRIVSAGETTLLVGQLVDRSRFEEINQTFVAEGKEPATAEPTLQGISQAALSTESLFAAASGQAPIKVLARAAVAGQVDSLAGLYENVIMGRLSPDGPDLLKSRRVLEATENEAED